MSPKQRRQIIVLFSCLLTFVLVISSRELIFASNGLGWLRGLTLFGSGMTVLILVRRMTIEIIGLKVNGSRWLRTFLKVFSFPGLIIGGGILFFMSSCSFDGWHSATEEEIAVRGTRVYKDYFRAPGIWGASGIAVYQERQLWGPISQRRRVCEVWDFGLEINFELIDDHTLGCSEDFKKRKVELPF